MLTQEKIDQFYIDVDALGLKKKKNATIQRATGFPKSNVSEWLRKIKIPSEKFIDTFYEKFGEELAKSSTNDLPNDHRSGELGKILDASTIKITLQDYINKIEQHNTFLQRIIESGLVDIKASLNDARNDLEWLEKWQWAEHKVQMQALDKLMEKDRGTLAAEAGTLLSGDQLEVELGGRKTNDGKSNKEQASKH